MDKKSLSQKLFVVLFGLGLFYLFNSRANITGAVVGPVMPLSISAELGMLLVMLAFLVLLAGFHWK